MDSPAEILSNAREKLGFSGIRNIKDLGAMKQETLEKKLRMHGTKLTTKSIVSVYMAWLAEQLAGLPASVRAWPATAMCTFLKTHTNCSLPDALTIWGEIVEDALNGNAAEMPQRERLFGRASSVEDALKRALSPSSGGRRGPAPSGGVAAPQQQPRATSGVVKPRHTCHRCNTAGHLRANCPTRPTPKAQEPQQNPGGSKVNTEVGAYQPSREEIAYHERRLLDTRQASIEPPYDEPSSKTGEASGSRSVMWRNATPTDGRLSPWSEDDQMKGEPSNAAKKQKTAAAEKQTTVTAEQIIAAVAAEKKKIAASGKQRTREERIAGLEAEADDFLARLAEEFSKANISIPGEDIRLPGQYDANDSSTLAPAGEVAQDDDAPRKRQKRASPAGEIREPEDTKPRCDKTDEKRVLTDSRDAPLTLQPKLSTESSGTAMAVDQDNQGAMMGLFQHRGRGWVREPRPRPTALDMWDTSTQYLDEEEKMEE